MYYFLLILSFFVYFSCNNEGREKGEKIKSLYLEKNKAFLQAKQRKDEKQMKKVIKEFNKVYNYAFVALEKKYQGLRYLAQLHMEKKYYLKAIEVFEKIHSLYPYKKVNYFEMGICYFYLFTSSVKQREREKYFLMSKKVFQKGLELFPTENDLKYGIGMLYGMYGKVNQDENYLQKGIGNLRSISSLNRFYVTSLFSIAHFSLLSGDKETAILSYEKILKKVRKKSKFYKQASENLKKLNKN